MVLHGLAIGILFIHSSADAHVGGFHLSAIANNSITNIVVQVSIWVSSILWGIYLKVELLGHTVSLRLTS